MMEVERNGVDFDEIEMLLCEIPSMASGNTPNESGLAASSQDFKISLMAGKGDGKSSSCNFGDFLCSQSGKHGSTVAFCSSSTYQMPSCANSFSTPLIKKHQNDGTVEQVKLTEQNEYQTPITDINRNELSLMNDQSLTSAFGALDLNEGREADAKNPGPIKCQTSLEQRFLVNGQYSNIQKNSLSGLDSVAAVSSTENMPNGMNLANPASKFLPTLVNVNGTYKFNGEISSRESEMKQGHGALENFLSGSREHLQSLPACSGAAMLPSGMHSLSMLAKAPFPCADFPVPAFPQPYYLNVSSPYIQSHQPEQRLTGSHIVWSHLQEEPLCRMPHVFYMPQLQNQEPRLLPHEVSPNVVLSSIAKEGPVGLYNEMPMTNRDLFRNANAVSAGINQPGPNARGSGHCQYYAQGICGSGDSCHFAHEQEHVCATNSVRVWPTSIPGKDFQGLHSVDKRVRQMFPEKIFTRSQGLNLLKPANPVTISGHDLKNPVSYNGRLFSSSHSPSIPSAGSFQLNGQSSRESSPENLDFRHASKLQHHKYNSVDEVVGRIYLMAKDQHGCRFLQRMFTEGSSEDVEKIFVEVIGHIVELMTDPFGNYLVQKLLEVCNEDQRMRILKSVTRRPGDLIKISCDMHGTRAVQKVIETLKNPEQISVVISSLKPGIVTLIKDINGNHVAQRCLSNLMPKYSEFLYEAATAHCAELATDRHGCCVLQKCLQHSSGEQKQRLISEISSNALVLSQDPFGNYVVQFIIEQGVQWATENVLQQLQGNYGYLSMQKYSSNVVEKCLKFAGDAWCTLIIQELIDNSQLGQISQDPYGNYVVQSALAESKGAIHAAFVEAIRPHVQALRSSPFGKKVLSCNSLKN